MKKMTKAEIREFNSKVEYNESVASWVVDLISCAIFFPMIVEKSEYAVTSLKLNEMPKTN